MHPLVAAARARHAFPALLRAPRTRPLKIGGELSVDTLLAAYSRGIFPWTSDPAQWWCPDPRFVVVPELFHVPKSLARTARQPRWELGCDMAFAEVIAACAEQPRPGQDGTWITPRIQRVYTELHEAGFAHSIEVRVEGRLVGGLYGVAIGALFCGESMFFRVPDASKVAFAAFAPWAFAHGIGLIDCQQPTDHLARFGGACARRADFLEAVEQLIERPGPPSPWSFGKTFLKNSPDIPNGGG